MKKLMFVLVAVFSLAMVTTSCKETKKEAENTDAVVEEAVEAVEEAKEEMAAVYACPMDCEEGKTYAEAGTCPECKMDLKLVEAEAETEMQHADDCKCMEAGECKCEEGKCECQKEMAVADKECTKCEPGACQCKA